MNKSIDDMSANEVIELYYEKHHAIRQGDLNKLLAIKKHCPELFIEEKDKEIRDMIDYAKNFQASDRYKELCKLELREKLVLIKNMKEDN